MAPSGDPGPAAAPIDLRVLLPFSCDTLRIPDELAADIGGGEALVVAPYGKGKIRRVEVGRDGDGAFLGRRWPEFAAACGVGAGWVLALRHRGRGVLTVKAFDDSCCLREFGAPTPPSAASDDRTSTSKGATRKLQFLGVFSKDFMEKMLIPAEFVRRHFPKMDLNSCMATILGPHGKVHCIKLEMDRLDLFFTGGWSEFVAFHSIKEADSLILCYEGNMIFTVMVFGSDGCQRECKHMEARIQQTSTSPKTEAQLEAPSASTRKRRCRSRASLQSNGTYKIGPSSWIKKRISTNNLERHLALATAFSNAIGLREPCTITLKTSMDSTKSWQVRGLPWKKRDYLLVQGWRRFCQENSLKEGDLCMFNIIKTTLWHVVIKRCKEKMNFCYETSSVSTENRISKYNGSGTDGQRRPKGSMTVLDKASSKKTGIFEIGPPAWITTEINTHNIENRLYLSQVFCEAIGIHKACTITLKTSMRSTRSWQARVLPYKYCSHHIVGPGWRSFCLENGIKVGDVCTFNIIESNLWHVVITPLVC